MNNNENNKKGLVLSYLALRQSIGVKGIELPFVLLLSLLLTCCTPPASPEPIYTPTEIPAPTEIPIPEDDSIIVSSTSNSGPGSLRQALLDAQYGDSIRFNMTVFPPDAPATIFITNEELPHINVDNLTLDASNAGVILDGSQLEGDWIAGLQIVSSSGNQIMGLQVTNFTGPGIAISGESTQNIIGGDRSIGEGPWGQGNLISNNDLGIDISTPKSTNNSVTGNLIGVDLKGTYWLGNQNFGIHIYEGARENTVGPDNIIAYNGRDGVYIDPPDREHNTVNQNRIFDNGIGIGWPEAPALFDFDLAGGTVVGATCPGCKVEIYSATNYPEELDEAVLEGETTANENGVFTFNNEEPLPGPRLTARTTDLNGKVSFYYSYPLTTETENRLVLQMGNEQPRKQYLRGTPLELADNHIAFQYDGISYAEDRSDFTFIYPHGFTRARVSISGMEPELVDWEKPEFEISQAQDEHFDRLSENGVIVTYVLMFWDKEIYSGGEGLPCARFKTEEEIEHWLEYVRFTVDHLKDWVKYFELWNEPDIANYCPKWIEVDDYINLIKRTVPVIRDVAPEAKIVIGAVSKTYYPQAQNYLFGLLESDVMPLVDVVSFHPMYGESPKYNHEKAYYDNYPAFLQQIMDTAAANGFDGEFHADEVGWTMQPDGGQSGEFSETETNKYFLRAVMLHRGMGVDLGIRSGSYTTKRVTALMAGVEPSELLVEIKSSTNNIMSYTFTTLDGDRIVVVWTNGIAVENDPGIEATIMVPGFAVSDVSVIDLLNNLEQELVFKVEDGDLVIENLLVRDYPLVIRLSP